MKRLCDVIDMSRDAYYKRFCRSEASGNERAVVLQLVKNVRVDEPRVGTRKLHHRISPALERCSIKLGRDGLFDVLREEGMLVKPKRRFEKTTYSRHQYVVAPNRIKELKITRPNQVFVSDITYVRLLRREFAYLFLVTDAYSRKIVGFHLSKDLSHYSALLALDKALKDIGDTMGIIHHSDRGSQYCCHEYLRFLGENNMVPSMTDESHCYQNAIAERVNGILKGEFNIDAVFQSFGEAKNAVEHAIGVYNMKRTHWSLNLRTPNGVYREAA